MHRISTQLIQPSACRRALTTWPSWRQDGSLVDGSLVDAGADVNAVTMSGISAMHFALDGDMVRWLAAHGASVDVRAHGVDTPPMCSPLM